MKTYDNSKQCTGTDYKSAPAGKTGWFHTVGPNATKFKLYQLEKQGGTLLPQYRNLSTILHKK